LCTDTYDNDCDGSFDQHDRQCSGVVDDKGIMCAGSTNACKVSDKNQEFFGGLAQGSYGLTCDTSSNPEIQDYCKCPVQCIGSNCDDPFTATYKSLSSVEHDGDIYRFCIASRNKIGGLGQDRFYEIPADKKYLSYEVYNSNTGNNNCASNLIPLTELDSGIYFTSTINSDCLIKLKLIDK